MQVNSALSSLSLHSEKVDESYTPVETVVGSPAVLPVRDTAGVAQN